LAPRGWTRSLVQRSVQAEIWVAGIQAILGDSGREVGTEITGGGADQGREHHPEDPGQTGADLETEAEGRGPEIPEIPEIIMTGRELGDHQIGTTQIVKNPCLPNVKN